MPTKKYFSYTRVSTQRQGQHGTSLAEQQAAIDRFATQWNLPIVKRFTETQTAAKRGRRTVYSDMLRQLKQGKASGVIIHRIDRSARNLIDWAELLSLSDGGLEVHFAAESLDLGSRGGRLSADIQAVVASDFIRNLREETKKGLYGRLRQGLYPFRAVCGYLDDGGGKPKRIDPTVGPLVKLAFEMYSTGDIGLHDLAEALFRRGLHNRSGKKITLNGLSTILHNPFYFGLIRIKKTGEFFRGVHEPLIPKKLYDRVQDVLEGKNIKKSTRRFFAYRRLVRCQSCSNFLIPERKKESFIYYRCHTRGCDKTALKEEQITEQYLASLESITIGKREFDYMASAVKKMMGSRTERMHSDRANLSLQLDQIEERLSRLADAFLDSIIDKGTYLKKKEALILEEASLRHRLTELQTDRDPVEGDLAAFLELLNSAYLSFKLADPIQRRKLAKIITLEFRASGKSGSIKLKPAFQMVADRPRFPVGRAHRETTRNFSAWVSRLVKFFYETAWDADDSFRSLVDPLAGYEFATAMEPVRKFFKYPHCKLKPTAH